MVLQQVILEEMAIYLRSDLLADLKHAKILCWWVAILLDCFYGLLHATFFFIQIVSRDSFFPSTVAWNYVSLD